MDTSFCLHPVVLRDNIVPCGCCPVCRMKYRKQMAVRLYMEKSIEKPDYSFFITLTYNEDAIPIKSGRKCFDKRHIQTFFDSCKHKLRHLGYTQRYFVTCEYGEEGYRPHYHFIALLYHIHGANRVRFARHQYLHDVVEPLWHRGFCYDGNVSLASIMYCTAYALKDDEALERDWTGFDEGRPFRLFSLRPGLGLTDKCIEWWTNFVYNDGEYRSGIRLHLPKRSVSSCIPVGVKRHFKEDQPEFYEELKRANKDSHDKVLPSLVDNISRYGAKKCYASYVNGHYIIPHAFDDTPDKEIETFRKAVRELAKRQRNPLK